MSGASPKTREHAAVPESAGTSAAGSAEASAVAAGRAAVAKDPLRFIHLLYVPTDACSLRCSYCYLDHDTLASPGVDPACADGADPLPTLAFAVEKLRAAGVVPFNISLHGGEVTCLPPERFEALVGFIDDYYRDNAELISAHGFKVGRPHIKTNLYGIDRHLDAIARHKVSVSGSLDVPFSLHETHRRTADGRPTLERILANVELLRGIGCRKKASATIFRPHFERMGEIVDDLRFLHRETCLDMNDFNFMIGFSDPNDPRALPPLTEDEQVAFYRRMHAEFDGTDLDAGVRGPWFAEFTPAYCTGSVNCGEKFFLLDWRGDVWSCVRGQGHGEFFYGNIFRDEVADILAASKTRIFEAHNRMPLASKCVSCGYLRLCLTGCPFVKRLCNSDASYTCKLQQAIYSDYPDRYPKSRTPERDAYRYAELMRPLSAEALRPVPTHVLPRNVPSLTSIIEADPAVRPVFDRDAFKVEIDGVLYPMIPQILRTTRDVVDIARTSRIRVLARKDILETSCRWPVNNALYLMLLSGNLVTYGDENRTKQEHVATHQVFFRTLERMSSPDEAFFCFDATALVTAYYDALSFARPNNLFATTTALRDAHYAKHKANAYYHIQTINLPFPNIELSLDDEEEADESQKP